MTDSARERLFATARWIVALLILGSIYYWYVNLPKPLPASVMYFADPTTDCVYPEGDSAIKKLKWTDESGQKLSWEQFPNLEEAKAAGYRLCH